MDFRRNLNISQILCSPVEGLYSTQVYNHEDTVLKPLSIDSFESNSERMCTMDDSNGLDALYYQGCAVNAERLASSLTDCGTFRKIVENLRALRVE